MSGLEPVTDKFDEHPTEEDIIHDMKRVIGDKWKDTYIETKKDVYGDKWRELTELEKEVLGDALDTSRDNVVPIRKDVDLFGHPSNAVTVYDFDSIPDGKWFGMQGDSGRPRLNANNVALVLKRTGFVVQHDQWYDSVHVSHTGYKINGLLEDRNVTSRMKEVSCATFNSTVRPIDFREAIDILARRNTINSRIAYLDSFLPHYDKDYDWVGVALQILDCDTGEYEREIVRSLFAGVVQRSYFPGCALQRVISLIGGQGINKSDFTIMLAGNPTPEERRWLISKNIFDLKDLDKASAVKGVAVVEHAEMEGLHKVEVAKYKADTTMMILIARCMPRTKSLCRANMT
jgi:Virulence-associated protein E